MKQEKEPTEQVKKRIEDTLDTETSFANMNVEGMPWYEPGKDGGGGNAETPQLSKSEQRALIRGALLAALPFIGGLILLMAILFALAWLWLR